MIPKEVRCKYCGRPILFVVSEGKRIPIESRFTPFKKRTEDGSKAPALYTNEGMRIPCTVLPEERENEADGFAHRFHYCPAKPMPKRKKPLTRREKYRENIG